MESTDGKGVEEVLDGKSRAVQCERVGDGGLTVLEMQRWDISQG